MLHEDWMKMLRSSLSPVWTRGKLATAICPRSAFPGPHVDRGAGYHHRGPAGAR